MTTHSNLLHAGLVATFGIQQGLVVAYALAVVGTVAVAELAALGWRRYDVLRAYQNHVRQALYGLSVGIRLFAAQHNAALLGGAL